MKKTKIFSMFFATALLATVLTGCNNTTPANEDTAKEDTVFKPNFSQFLDDNGYLRELNVDDYITPVDCMGLVVPKEYCEATDTEVQEEIDAILEDYAGYGAVVQNGSKINIDYEGGLVESTDKVSLIADSAYDVDTTVGSKDFMEGFLEPLIGHTVGETVEVVATYPQNYPDSDFRGKKATFTIRINSMEGATDIPEFTDEFIRQNSSYLSVEEFKKDCYTTLSRRKFEDYLWNTFKDMAKKQVKEMPEVVLEYERETLRYASSQGADKAGMTRKEYYSRLTNGGTEEDYFEQEKENIYSRACTDLAVWQVAKQMNITISDEQLQSMFSSEDHYKRTLEEVGVGELKFGALNITITNIINSEAVRE